LQIAEFGLAICNLILRGVGAALINGIPPKLPRDCFNRLKMPVSQRYYLLSSLNEKRY